MSNLITGVLVSLDAEAKLKVETVTLPKGDHLEEMYQLMDCECFTSAGYLPKGDAVYADDNGLYNIGPDTQVTNPKWYPQPLVGKLLIMGLDHETGDSVDIKSTVEEVREQIIWCEPMHVAYLLMKAQGII